MNLSTINHIQQLQKEITQQQAEIERLRAALEPFAAMLPSMDGNANMLIYERGITFKLRKQHFIDARRALESEAG